MRDIALAILIVGLCFYEAYRVKIGSSIDNLASLVAIIASIELLIGK